VITGASSGIGAATAVACAAAGMRVVISARRVEKLEEVARRCDEAGNTSGGRAIAVACDVRRDEDVQRLIERALLETGRLDVAFANAGYGLFGSIAEMTDAQMRDIFETNYFGTVRLVQAAAKVMRPRKSGHILICSSACSEIGLPMYGAYAATKAAQDSIGGAMRAELAGEGIAVTTIHPIGTRTAFFEVVEQVSEKRRGVVGLNTPRHMMHPVEKVAQRIVKCLRRPRPEVWPSVLTRYALALTTAFPGLGAWAMRRAMKRRGAAGVQ